MKKLFVLGFLLSWVYGQSGYYLFDEKDIKQSLVNPHKNVLKLYDITVDPIHGKAYTTGSQTEYISVIDLDNSVEIGSIQMPFKGLNVLKCNPANEHLLVTPLTSPYTVYYISPSSQVIGTLNLFSSLSGVAFDVSNNVVYLGDGNIINIINGNNFSVLSTINAGMPLGALEIDSINQKLYAISRNLISGNVVLKVYSIQNPYSLLQTILIPSTDVMGNFSLDIPNNRIFLFGKNVIKVYDLVGGTCPSSTIYVWRNRY